MTSDDSTPPPLPSASGPRKRLLGGSPPGVRTAGEIAADSERSAAAAEGTAAETASAPVGDSAVSAPSSEPAAPAEDPKAAKKAEKQAAREERKTARAEKKAAKAESPKDGAAKGAKDTKAAKEKKPVTQTVRTRAAALIWTVAVVCALVLAVGALLVALQANQDNAAVGFVLSAADGLDLGIFSRENGIFEFDGPSAEVRNALVNWGLGAVAYLVVGKVLDRLVHP